MKADFIIVAVELSIAVGLLGAGPGRRQWARGICLLIAGFFLCFVLPTAYLVLVEHKPQLLPFLLADLLASAASVALAASLTARAPVRARARAASLAMLSGMVCLGALEAAFPALFAVSDGFATAVSSRIWFAKHWKPITRLGYRDIDRGPEETDGKKLLLVVGDSLVAGHGIKDISDRFSNLLQSKLGPSWTVANVAQCGWDTKAEEEAIRNYPGRPRAVVLSYFINDIEGACAEGGFPQPVLIEPPAQAVRPVIDEFRLANFVYWRLYRFSRAASMAKGYMGYLKGCYENPRAWDIHRGDLLRIVNYCRKRRIRLAAVVFPALGDVEGTKPFAAKAAHFLKERGAVVIEASSLLSGQDPSRYMVNALDAHPNEAFNKIIAEALYQALR